MHNKIINISKENVNNLAGFFSNQMLAALHSNSFCLFHSVYSDQSVENIFKLKKGIASTADEQETENDFLYGTFFHKESLLTELS
jgi:hypothetical protein